MKKFSLIDYRFLIFLSISSLYIFLGLMGTFYNDLIYFRCNLFYDTDTSIKYNLIYMNSTVDIDRHPFIFALTPILKMISYLVWPKNFALILFQAIVATLSNVLLFWIMKKINIRHSTAIFFTLIYAFSFSTLFFVLFPEIYLYSSCVGLLLTYFVCCYHPCGGTQVVNEELFFVFIVAFLCVLGFGINPVNIVLYIPLLIYFFGNVDGRKKRDMFWHFLFLFVIIFCFLAFVGEILYSLVTSLAQDYPAVKWIKIDFSVSRLIKMLQETLIAPFYALETSFDAKEISWNFVTKQSFLLFLPALIFVLAPFCKRKLLQVPKIIWIFCSIVLIHTVLNFFYNSTWFLYSQNYLFFLVIILAYFYCGTSVRLQYIVLSLFLLFQILCNFNMLAVFIRWLNEDVLYVVLDALQTTLFIDSIIIVLVVMGAVVYEKFKQILGKIKWAG